MAQQTTGRAWLAGGHNPVVSLPRLPFLRIAPTVLPFGFSGLIRDVHHCKMSISNRCKPSTAKTYLLVTIKFACIEFNRLRARHRWVGGGSCLDYFGSP